MRRRVVAAAVLSALLVAGCGSASPPAHLPGLPPLAAHSSPTATVRYALLSLTHSAYDATAQNVENFSFAGVPASLLSRFRERLARTAGNVTMSGQITDLSNFRMMMMIGTTRLNIRARGGSYQASENGGSFQQIPSSQANTMLTAIQGNAGTLADAVVVKRTLTPGEIDGIRVDRYLVAISGATQDRAVSPVFSAVGTSLPKNALQAGPATGIMSINAHTHMLVQAVQHDSGTIELAAFRPGYAGEMLYAATSTNSYSHIVPHAR